LEFEEEKSFEVPPNEPSSQMVVLSYCSPLEIQRALQEPHNTIVDILAVVVAVDASHRTPYYPDEIRKVTLMDDRYVSKMVFDGHDLHILVSIFWYFVRWPGLSSYNVTGYTN
jgi:hypothetical protein